MLNDEIKSMIEELCSDLESEINTRTTPSMREYPSIQRNYDRDMDVVIRARAVLDKVPQQVQDESAGFTIEKLKRLSRDLHACEYDSDVQQIADELDRQIAKLAEQAPPQAVAIPEGWEPLTNYGQIQVGNWISFKLGNQFICVKAKEILNPGTSKEEIVYNRKKNYYFITSMVIDNSSNHKDVKIYKSNFIDSVKPLAVIINNEDADK